MLLLLKTPDIYVNVKLMYNPKDYVDPKQISVIFKSEKGKKKKKKERSSPLFRTFPTSISNFSPSLYYFPSFLLNFYPFPLFSLPLFSQFSLSPFFLAYFFLIRQQKFPGQKSLGGTLPPPACYATGMKHAHFDLRCSSSLILWWLTCWLYNLHVELQTHLRFLFAGMKM